jgi:tRNA(fMet)-specific endonuclease VapC
MAGEMVVDTCVVSFFIKSDSRAKLYKPHVNNKVLYVSFQTLAELLRWPSIRGWGEAKTTEFHAELDKYAVIPFDRKICEHWSQIMNLKGRPTPVADAWIAATALAYDAEFITHNRKDFSHIPGLKIITESSEE